MQVEVFAVEATAVQICWVAPTAGTLHVGARWAGAATDTDVAADGPGAIVVDGLPHSTTVTFTLKGAGLDQRRSVTTLAPPPGRRLSRFGAINDTHLGAPDFGTLRPIWNDDPRDPAPLRAMRAALREMVEWGADAIVVKGDLTQRGRTHEWELGGSLLEATGLPVVMIEGNHETKKGAIDGRALMARYGIDLAVTRPTHLDLPGVRIIGMPTAAWHLNRGWISDRVREEASMLAAELPGTTGAVVAFHQYPQRFRYPTLYPRGIPGPDATRALDALARAHPATMVLAGHSHRHRRHEHGPLVVAETGSTKDFPASWAGYTVYEGGIMQTSRRIMDPSVMAWSERGRRVGNGIWGVWAPGFRSHRCFAYLWPTA